MTILFFSLILKHLKVIALLHAVPSDCCIWFCTRLLYHRKVSHPKLVKLYGVCTHQKPMYLVFEFLENGCLTEFLRSKKGCVSQETLLSMCIDVSEAMAYLESSNFIHRDLVNICIQQLPFRSHSVIIKSKFVTKRGFTGCKKLSGFRRPCGESLRFWNDQVCKDLLVFLYLNRRYAYFFNHILVSLVLPHLTGSFWMTSTPATPANSL